MQVGIVGKPNCGKSTFFKAMTLAEVEIADYPFATIKPNSGVGYVKVECVDKEFDVQCNPREGYCVKNQRFVPVQVIDVAGLVPGAYDGKGMGNQFLDDLRQADALIHVIDVSGSTNEKGEPVDALSYDPAEDIKFLEVEIDMWFLQILKKGWEKFARTLQQEKKEVHTQIAKQLSGLGVNEKMCEDIIREQNLDSIDIKSWKDEDLKKLATAFRKKTKPMIIAANKIDIPGAEKNLERLQKEFTDYTIIPCSAESELALREASKHQIIEYIPGEEKFILKDESKINEKQKKALNFIQKNILDNYGSTGVQQIIDYSVFNLLEYIAIFPGGIGKLQDQDGNFIPDCFLIPKDSTALDFAYKIHTDLGNSFIRAIDVKSKMTVGKEHVLKHRDVVEIISGK